MNSTQKRSLLEQLKRRSAERYAERQKHASGANEDTASRIRALPHRILDWWRANPECDFVIHQVFSLLLSWSFVLTLYFGFFDTDRPFNALSLYLAFFITSAVYAMSLEASGIPRAKLLFGANLLRYLCLVLLLCYALFVLTEKETETTLLYLELILALGIFIFGIIDGYTCLPPLPEKAYSRFETAVFLLLATTFGLFSSFQILKVIGIFINTLN